MYIFEYDLNQTRQCFIWNVKITKDYFKRNRIINYELLFFIYIKVFVEWVGVGGGVGEAHCDADS